MDRKSPKGKVNYKKLYREMQMVFQDPDSSLDPRLEDEGFSAEPCKGFWGETRRRINSLVLSSLACGRIVLGTSGQDPVPFERGSEAARCNRARDCTPAETSHLG